MSSTPQPIVWTIAASDSGGGAGVQADIKTCFDLGVHSATVMAAVTAQNTQGVQGVYPVDAVVLTQQLTSLNNDLPAVIIKVGVLASTDNIHALTEFLQTHKTCPVILDPVLAPTQGKTFTEADSVAALIHLLPYIDVITPNIPEAEALTGIRITNAQTQEQAAKVLIDLGVGTVILKGGHTHNEYHCQDLFLSAEQHFWMTQDKQATIHTHGTGCTLSAAMAAFMAHGKAAHDAAVLANAYICKGLRLAQSHTANPDQKGSVTQTDWPNNLQDFPQISITADTINNISMPACETPLLGLYPVVDSIEWLEKLLRIGVMTIQLRVKDIAENELEIMVEQAAALGRQYRARLFINDYWQLAIKYNAYGVHLGQEDMADADVNAIRNAGLRLGISTHGEYELTYAATFTPSYLAIGAVFPTDTKAVVEVGLDNLYRWVNIANHHYPLVAIGGINQENIDSVLKSGVGSVAVVSAVTKAKNYKISVEELSDTISRYNQQ